MAATAIQDPKQGRDLDSVGLRMPRLGIDPMLTLAAIGLGVASLVTLGGLSHAQMVRQALFLGVGLVLMLVMSRFDYSRLRELKWGFYVILIGAILVVIGVGHSTAGSTRAIGFSSFSFESSEVGKVLLIVFLAAFVVDSSRKTSSRELVARVFLLALIPTMLVIVEPDLGSGLVYVSAAFAVLYIAGVALAPSGGGLRARRDRARAGAGRRPDGRLPHLPVRAPDGVPRSGVAARQEGRRGALAAAAVAVGDRRRRQVRPRRGHLAERDQASSRSTRPTSSSRRSPSASASPAPQPSYPCTR